MNLIVQISIYVLSLFNHHIKHKEHYQYDKQHESRFCINKVSEAKKYSDIACFPYKFGVATTFNHAAIDIFNKDEKFACIVKARNKINKKIKEFLKRGHVVAHKHLPCWTEIKVCLGNNKCLNAVVADWGPKRADIDLFHNLSRDLGHNGMELAYWSIIPTT